MKENPYPRLVRNPPFAKRLLARLIGRVKLYTDREHFSRPLDIYLSYCKEHGVYYEDYLHGYTGYTVCPLCWAEEQEDDPEVDDEMFRLIFDDLDEEEWIEDGEPFDEMEDEDGAW